MCYANALFNHSKQLFILTYCPYDVCLLARNDAQWFFKMLTFSFFFVFYINFVFCFVLQSFLRTLNRSFTLKIVIQLNKLIHMNNNNNVQHVLYMHITTYSSCFKWKCVFFSIIMSTVNSCKDQRKSELNEECMLICILKSKKQKKIKITKQTIYRTGTKSTSSLTPYG